MALLPDPLTAIHWPSGWNTHAAPATPLAHLPRLTVITPSYNQGQYLEATLRSVLMQGYPNLEYIVVDGGSRDNSRSIIEHYAAHLSWWVSEKDRGQTDAIQKGLDRATGDWWVWINSDDLLAPGALWTVAAHAQAEATDVIAGVTQYFSDTRTQGQRPSRNFSARAFILDQLGSGMKWHQPAVWLQRKPMHGIRLNQRLQYCFDHELLVRYLFRHTRVRYLDDVLAWFRFHDESKSVSQALRFRTDQVESYRKLAEEAEFAPLRDDLLLAARAVQWLHDVDVILEDRTRPRWQRFAEVVRGAMQDRAARCTSNTRRSALRILKYGGGKRR